jgi:hypothetical protein
LKAEYDEYNNAFPSETLLLEEEAGSNDFFISSFNCESMVSTKCFSVNA